MDCIKPFARRFVNGPEGKRIGPGLQRVPASTSALRIPCGMLRKPAASGGITALAAVDFESSGETGKPGFDFSDFRIKMMRGIDCTANSRKRRLYLACRFDL